MMDNQNMFYCDNNSFDIILRYKNGIKKENMKSKKEKKVQKYILEYAEKILY